MIELIRDILTDHRFLVVWLVLVGASLIVLMIDLVRNNPFLGSLMKLVWFLTVLYSGPFGLAVYVYAGRGQISRDSLWRRGFRSTAHCYSGCGLGEVVGIVITVGILASGNLAVIAVTFSLAYVFGYALTVGPLVNEGVAMKTALWDAFVSETGSITVMEIVAIGVDLVLAKDATMGEPLFWSSLFFSLSMGLLAAYPVNLLLIRWGIKEGMMNPKDMLEQART